MTRDSSWFKCFFHIIAFLLLATGGHRAHGFVNSDNCGVLNLRAVAQLVTIELDPPNQFAKHADGLSVTLDCDTEKNAVSVEIWDPITEKKMQRTISGPAQKGDERMIALVISQLYKASWSELLISNDESSASAASPDDIAAAAKVAQNTFQNENREWLASVGAGARLLGLKDRFTGFHSQLSVGRIFRERWIPAGYLNFDMGEKDVEMGAIRFFSFALGLAGAVRFNPSSRVVIDFGTAVGVTWSRLSGQVDGPGLIQSSTSGFSGEGLLFAGPGWRLSDLILRLQVEGGYAFENATLGVGSNESFTPGGFFAGISLHIVYAFATHQ